MQKILIAVLALFLSSCGTMTGNKTKQNNKENQTTENQTSESTERSFVQDVDRAVGIFIIATDYVVEKVKIVNDNSEKYASDTVEKLEKRYADFINDDDNNAVDINGSYKKYKQDIDAIMEESKTL